MSNNLNIDLQECYNLHNAAACFLRNLILGADLPPVCYKIDYYFPNYL